MTESRWRLRSAAANLFASAGRLYHRHWLGGTIVTVLFALVLYGTRAITHEHVVMPLRKKSFLLAAVIFVLLVFVWARKRHPLVKMLAWLACIGSIVSLYMWGGPAHDYVALYLRYESLQKVRLDKLPVTGYERTQPENSIYSLALEKASSETATPMKPDWMRIGAEYRWTSAIEPAHWWPRLTGNVNEVLVIHDDNAVPYFERKYRFPVDFDVGENMLLGSNSKTATVKAFGLWRYLNYEPYDVKYVTDDSGEVVQVVTLIKWTGLPWIGWFFPWPEFGGVQVIRQHSHEGPIWKRALHKLDLAFNGAGEWIRPEDVQKHRFLVGQNIISDEVVRFVADSWRFQKGFTGPLPGRHEGDVRIPDLTADQNKLPFTSHYDDMNDTAKKVVRSGLFKWIGLEPADPEKHGLSVSLFVPADGSSPAFYYDHEGENLTGVSAIAGRVMDTRREYNWSRHRPVEHRPYIRDFDGVRRFLFMTTVVTFKQGTTGENTQSVSAAEKKEELIIPAEQQQRFIAGTTLPNTILTDAKYAHPVWMGEKIAAAQFDPAKWVEELRADPWLMSHWKTEPK